MLPRRILVGKHSLMIAEKSLIENIEEMQIKLTIIIIRFLPGVVQAGLSYVTCLLLGGIILVELWAVWGIGRK